MDDVLAEIDLIITDCAKRDLVPAAEVIDRLLDLRNYVELSRSVELATPTPT